MIIKETCTVPSDINPGRFKLIYPSYEHCHYEYKRYLEHAKKLYEQFTGSYSRNTFANAANNSITNNNSPYKKMESIPEQPSL